MKVCPTCQRHILVVDDDALVCETVTMLLRFDGHLVDAAMSGEQALAIFQPRKFDLIITDFFMPAMTGGQLAQSIKTRAPGQPVVLLTAYAERFRSPGHGLSGIDSILEKPIAINALRETIIKLTPAQNGT